MAILGLLGTEQYSSERFKSVRRSVFYQYPNGAAPLMGILSMLEGEVLNDPEFSWYEKRFIELKSTTEVNGTTSGFWYADSSGSLGSALAATAADKVKDTAYWIRTSGYSKLRGSNVLKITGLTVTGGTADIQLKILPNSSGVWYNATNNGYVRVTPVATLAAVTNAHTGNSGLEVLVIGNYNEQGQTGSSEGGYNLPSSTSNACQIFRTPYSFTGTALKTAAKFDETGVYKDKAKEASLNHMVEMELQFLLGDYSKSTDSTSGLPTFTTGGIIFFLKLWEVGNGNSVSGITSTYGNRAVTSNSDDDKRIININGAISEANLDTYYERLFRYTNNTANEKIAFVGSGWLNVVNQLYKSKGVLNTDLPMTDTYGMDVVRHRTPFGIIYYKSHPLFTRNASMRYNALFLDVNNLKYRYMEGRDTDILKDRQPNDADYRKDEFLTEAGLENKFPEANMYMTGVTSYS